MMASKEGFRRVNALGRWIAIGGALLLLLGFLVRLWESRYAIHAGYSSAGIFMAPGFYLTVIGGLILAVGWIGDGFALGHDSENRSG